MSYITPNTTITLYKNVPLDPDYQHTIYFTSATQQNTYFSGLDGQISFDNHSYQRATRSSIRVSLDGTTYTYEKMYNFNYMRFRNTSYENKWYYAFITHVEWVNNKTVTLYYQLDLMQTWAFDYKIEKSFVERTHASTDVAGDNLVPESLETGDYIFAESLTNVADLTPLSIVMAVTRYHNSSAGNFDGGQFLNGAYSGLIFIEEPNVEGGLKQGKTEGSTDPDDYYGAERIKRLIKKYSVETGGETAIVSVFLAPTILFTETSSNTLWSETISRPNPTTLGTYTPRNKKLLTSPYTFLYATNYNGTSSQYNYEYFDHSSINTCDFTVTGDTTVGTSIMTYPHHYKGVGINKDEKMTFTGYPQLPWCQDVFTQWLAQKGVQLAIAGVGIGASVLSMGAGAGAMSLGASIGSVGTAAATGPSVITPQATGLSTTMANTALSTINRINTDEGFGGGFGGSPAYASLPSIGPLDVAIWKSLGSIATHAMMPPQAHGTSDSVLGAVSQTYNFGFAQKCIRPEFASRIDDYFSMYGYATKKVQAVNCAVRKRWTFVKTLGINAYATNDGIPAEDMEGIKKIYNNGITFWRYYSGCDIGNYVFTDNGII